MHALRDGKRDATTAKQNKPVKIAPTLNVKKVPIGKNETNSSSKSRRWTIHEDWTTNLKDKNWYNKNRAWKQKERNKIRNSKMKHGHPNYMR